MTNFIDGLKEKAKDNYKKEFGELEKINSLDDKGKKHTHSLKRIFNGEVI